MPLLDIWITVNQNELQFVSQYIPTLDWKGGELGVRLILEPINKISGLEKLHKDYTEAFKASESVKISAKKKKINIWPESLCEFLNGKKESQLQKYFKIVVYILDASKLIEPDKNTNIAKPQDTSYNALTLDRKDLNSIFKVDIIDAQRGFSDSAQTSGKLSDQMREYYDRHLDLEDMPDSSDVEAIHSIQGAQNIFDKKLHESFKEPLDELAKLGYPGIGNPKPVITAKIAPQDSLSHKSAVEHSLCDNESLRLPESYNGLGYQNLISIAFKMITFRDGWMRKGKMGKKPDNMEMPIPRLHLVLIEEPEAHLHTQVQYVFIKKAYETLRNNDLLRNKEDFSTQLVISTHSSHIVSGADFSNLRYFRRLPIKIKKGINTSAVVSMANTFGNDKDKAVISATNNKTKRFATRYIRTTHCDLFFADAIILVEGSAEKMMLPHFMKAYETLDSSYISILEVGGSHAHRLKSLVEKLGIPCLIITDLDSGEGTGHHKAVRPKVGKKYISSNTTLKEWLPASSKLDVLLKKDGTSKIKKDDVFKRDIIRVAYQTITNVQINGTEESYVPYTFEDALVIANIELFKNSLDEGPIGDFREAILNSLSSEVLAEKMFDAIKGEMNASGKRGTKLDKGRFILDVLYSDFFEQIKPPTYIEEGLTWLEKVLKEQRI